MKLSKHAKFWALGALGGVWLFALGVFAQQTLEINPSEQDLFSDLKAVFFLDRNGDEIKSIVRWNASGSTLVTAPTSELIGGEAKNTLQNNASIIGSTDSSNTSAGAFLIATNSGRVEGESMQSFIWGANNTTLSGFNTIAVATKDTNINADNALALASKNTNITAKDAIAIGWEDIKLKGQASLAIWSKIDSAAQGAMVFNAKNERLNLNNESNNTFVINAANGLIVNTNTSANPKIQLTVSGAIKLWEVNNAPAEASPYISTKKVGNVICVCGKVNNGNIAISKYSRNNKQHAEICQKVCNNETPTLPGQCGAAATNYPLVQTQWSTDNFCQWGLGYAGAKPTFPALGGQTTWTCESFPSGGVNCTATRKWCGDGIRAAGEQCDLGTNNGKPDSNCSASCENVKDPKCWANAKTYLGSDVAWAQPNGFCADDSVLSWSIPNFRSNCNKCGLRGFPYCFDVSFDANSAVCKSSSQSDIAGTKTWTCKNKNGKNLTCTTTKQPPMVAGKCNLTQLGECDAWVLSWTIKTINNGKRWECSGLYGGSNNTCSTCNNGYTYNETSTECEATTCPSWFTTYNGKCVQWKCETTPASSTPAKCEGNYEEISYSYQGKLIISSSNESSFECYESPWSNKTIRRSCCTPFPRNKGQTSPQLPPPPSHQWPQRPQQPGFHAWQQTPWRQTWLDPYCWWKFGVWGHSDPTSTVGVALAIPAPQIGVNEFSAYYSCTKDPEKFPDKCIRKQRKNTGSCSSLTQTKCEQTNWCNRISWTTTPAINKYICIDKEQNIISDNECVNAGLPKSCIHTCPSGFTTHNGKCIRLQCKDTTPGKCEGNYQKITNKYQGEMIGRWHKWGLTTLACYLPLPSTPAPSNDCCPPLNPPSSLPDQREIEEWPHYRRKYFPWSTHCWSQVGMWGYPDETSEKGFSIAVPSPDRNWYIVYAACKKDPEKSPGQCKKSQLTETISCESLNQTQCGSKSWCYRTTAASRKTICVDDQWNTAPDSLCSDAGLQLNCTSS